MINIIQYPPDTHFLKPLSLIGLGATIHEILTYPLDRIYSRMIAISSIQKSTPQSQFQAIIQAESYKGLYKGFRKSFDRNIIQGLSMYFCFQYFFLRYGLQFNEGQTRIEVKNQPYLKFCQDSNFYLIALGSALFSTIITQPSNIVTLKLQCEQLGLPKKKYWDNMKYLEDIMQYHKNSFSIAFTPGFKSRVLLLFSQFIAEINLFQQLLYQNGYIFINKRLKTNATESNIPLFGALGISVLVPVIFHPLNFLQKRYTFRKLQNMRTLTPSEMIMKVYFQQSQDIPNIQTIYRGLTIEMLRYSTRSMLIFYLLWNSANQIE